MEKKINIGQKAKVIITLTTKSSITKEEENSVIALFAKKYGIPEKNVRVDNIIVTDGNSSAEDGLNSNNVKSIHDPIFQQLLFKQYAAENEIELIYHVRLLTILNLSKMARSMLIMVDI